ncbi:MAG: hypothetical protein JWO82_4085 [Akkermansiaceae bacterium]|nr:hypothetical protein [Akkermansiaceae bacterium]
MPQRKAIFASAAGLQKGRDLGTHQLARTFARNGWDVLLLAAPIAVQHLISPSLRTSLDRYAVARKGLYEVKFDGGVLRALTPFAFAAPHPKIPVFNSEWMLANWFHSSLPSLAGTLARHGFDQADLLLSDTVLFSQVHPHLRNVGKSVFRVHDNNRAWGRDSEGYKHAESQQAITADLVVHSAETLEEYANSLGPDVHSRLLRNGVEYDLFAKSDLARQDGPLTILYMGEMSKRFDSDLIIKYATENPEVRFVLAGAPNKPIQDSLGSRSNVDLLGEVAYADLPAILQKCDIGIIPFSKSAPAALINATNPLKLYQYMASGLPVVALDYPGLPVKEAPCFVYDGYDGFCRSIDLAAAYGKRESTRLLAKTYDWNHGYRIICEGVGYEV